ncbi:hypothetical protein [Nonomuraea sp. MG754425]|nr:hypothetical protein [Nonomuraea sp. MG754425]
MLDQAAAQPLSTEYVANCGAIAEAWMRLHAVLVTGTFMNGH